MNVLSPSFCRNRRLLSGRLTTGETKSKIKQIYIRTHARTHAHSQKKYGEGETERKSQVFFFKLPYN